MIKVLAECSSTGRLRCGKGEMRREEGIQSEREEGTIALFVLPLLIMVFLVHSCVTGENILERNVGLKKFHTNTFIQTRQE